MARLILLTSLADDVEITVTWKTNVSPRVRNKANWDTSVDFAKELQMPPQPILNGERVVIPRQ